MFAGAHLDLTPLDTLTGVLQARLDGLPPAEKRALQQASVVGTVFWDQALADMTQRRARGRAEEPSRIRRVAGNLDCSVYARPSPIPDVQRLNGGAITGVDLRGGALNRRRARQATRNAATASTSSRD